MPTSKRMSAHLEVKCRQVFPIVNTWFATEGCYKSNNSPRSICESQRISPPAFQKLYRNMSERSAYSESGLSKRRGTKGVGTVDRLALPSCRKPTDHHRHYRS